MLGWASFLTLNFQCTLPPMVHPYPGEADIFNQPCGELALEGDR